MRLVKGNRRVIIPFAVVAITTTDLWSYLVSGRIGGDESSFRQAPNHVGYDLTARLTPLRRHLKTEKESVSSYCSTCDSKLFNESSSESPHVIDLPGSNPIGASPTIQVQPTPSGSAEAKEDNDPQSDEFDVLPVPVEITALGGSAMIEDDAAQEGTAATTETPMAPVCQIGYFGDFGTIDPPVPVTEILKGDRSGRFGISFEEKTQTIGCHQDYDPEHKNYSCANLVFDHCNVLCDGQRSCYNSTIENVPKQIDCLGEKSCYGANMSTALDGSVYCGGEESCQLSRVGVDENIEYYQIAHLYCYEHLSCAHTKVYNVKDLFCSGKEACKDVRLSGKKKPKIRRRRQFDKTMLRG